MRICILSQGRLEFAGVVESYMKLLSFWLLKRKYEVILIDRSLFKIRMVSPLDIQLNNKKILRLPEPIYIIGLFILGLITVLMIILENKKRRIDLIHATDSGYAGLTAILVSKLVGIPSCISVHSYRKFLLGVHLKSIVGRIILYFDSLIERFVYSNADKIIALNDSIKSYILSFGVDHSKVVKVPIAIQTNAFEKSKKYIGNKGIIQSNKVIIGYVGRLEPEKNLLSLLYAFKEVAMIKQNVYLYLIGDGSLRNQLEKYAKLAKISNKVCFLGMQSNTPFWFAKFDIFVLPSLTEGMPFVLLEAMAAGKAIVASNIPAIKEMVRNGKEALLFDPYSPEQLKEAVLKLYHNPELRRELGENAKKKAKQYDIGVVFPKIVEVYQEVLRNKNINDTRKYVRKVG